MGLAMQRSHAARLVPGAIHHILGKLGPDGSLQLVPGVLGRGRLPALEIKAAAIRAEVPVEVVIGQAATFAAVDGRLAPLTDDEPITRQAGQAFGAGQYPLKPLHGLHAARFAGFQK